MIIYNSIVESVLGYCIVFHWMEAFINIDKMLGRTKNIILKYFYSLNNVQNFPYEIKTIIFELPKGKKFNEKCTRRDLNPPIRILRTLLLKFNHKNTSLRHANC